MKERNQTEVRAWRSQAVQERAPGEGGRLLGCVYDLDFGVDTIDEAVYFAREGDYDDLWVEDVLQNGTWRAVRMKHDGLGRRASCLRMFEQFVRSRGGFAGPSGMREPGHASPAHAAGAVRAVGLRVRPPQRRAGGTASLRSGTEQRELNRWRRSTRS